MSTELAYSLCTRLLAFALFWHSWELVKLRSSYAENGIWRWMQIRQNYLFLPRWVQNLLDAIMPAKTFTLLMQLRMLTAVLVLFLPDNPLLLFYLFATGFLITVRWRGSFNGGSDYLSLILLLTLFIGAILPAFKPHALWYISLQVVISYFFAGIHKLIKKKWQSGEAVADFVSAPHYQPPAFILRLVRYKSISFIASWMILLFECLFPLIFVDSRLAIVLIAAGAVFHFTNFVIFGLNRFFWVWTASYPALIYVCKIIPA